MAAMSEGGIEYTPGVFDHAQLCCPNQDPPRAVSTPPRRRHPQLGRRHHDAGERGPRAGRGAVDAPRPDPPTGNPAAHGRSVRGCSRRKRATATVGPGKPARDAKRVVAGHGTAAVLGRGRVPGGVAQRTGLATASGGERLRRVLAVLSRRGSTETRGGAGPEREAWAQSLRCPAGRLRTGNEGRTDHAAVRASASVSAHGDREDDGPTADGNGGNVRGSLPGGPPARAGHRDDASAWVRFSPRTPGHQPSSFLWWRP